MSKWVKTKGKDIEDHAGFFGTRKYICVYRNPGGGPGFSAGYIALPLRKKRITKKRIRRQ